jgi:hypothetical protein
MMHEDQKSTLERKTRACTTIRSNKATTPQCDKKDTKKVRLDHEIEKGIESTKSSSSEDRWGRRVAALTI